MSHTEIDLKMESRKMGHIAGVQQKEVEFPRLASPVGDVLVQIVVPVGGDQNPHKIPIISTIWL